MTGPVKIPMLVDDMTLIDQLLLVSDEYARAENVGDTTVSWRLFGDGKKLTAIRRGSDLQVRRFERAVQWFSDNWPEEAKWPVGVDRPARAESAGASA